MSHLRFIFCKKAKIDIVLSENDTKKHAIPQLFWLKKKHPSEYKTN
jgi:hypothetical protein